MGLIDSIIGAESGGNPNAVNPRSSASSALVHMGDKFGANSCVGELLFSGRPPTVCGFVIPVTINAVDRMIFAGARPHVGEEILKRSPALANLDPAPAVQIKVVLARVSAALDHAAPNLVFRSGRPTTANRNCHSVRDVAFADNVSVEAPAALGIPGSEIVDASDYLSAAIALAKNLARQLSGFLNDIFGVAFNDKTTVSLSNIVSEGAH